MEIKICSTNIRYENDHDGIHSWTNRLPLYENFINNQKLDILGTQEGRESQIRSLDNLINLKMCAQHRDWIDVRMYPTLFYDDNKFELIEANDYWLSETPLVPGSSSFKSAFPRLATWMKIKSKIDAKKYFITNVHLDHILPETRIAQANVIIEMSKKINSENFPMFLIGDFNDNPNSQTCINLKTELELVDHWQLKNLPEETSHHGFKGEGQTGFRIDWALVSKNINCTKIILDKYKVDDIFLSDHFPLVATFIPN